MLYISSCRIKHATGHALKYINEFCICGFIWQIILPVFPTIGADGEFTGSL